MNLNFIIKQKKMNDCGVCCLAMVLGSLGEKNTYNILKKFFRFSEDGTTFAEIKAVAEKVGLESFGIKVSIDKIQSLKKYPYILHWENKHFVVLDAVKNNFAYLRDPAFGKIKITIKEFLKRWYKNDEKAGYAIVLNKSKEFDEVVKSLFHDQNIIEQKSSSVYGFLKKFIKPYYRYFLLIMTGLVLVAIMQLLIPFFTQALIDSGVNNYNLSMITIFTIGLGILFTSRTLIDFLREFVLLHVSNKINLSILAQFFRKLMKLSLDFFSKKSYGEFVQRIEDHERINYFITNHSFSVLFTISNIVILSIILLYFNITFFIVYVISMSLYIFCIRYFLKKQREIDYVIFNINVKEKDILYQIINGIDDIQFYNARMEWLEKWFKIRDHKFEYNLKSLKNQNNLKACSVFLINFGILIIQFFAARQVVTGTLTLGSMMAIISILGQLNSYITQLYSFIYSYFQTKLSIERITEFTEENAFTARVPNINFFESGNIHIKNLSYKYNVSNSEYALNNISIIIPKGKFTAIVGESGCGKTTLLKIFLKKIKDYEGRVYIGNTLLDHIDDTVWWDKCSVIMQDSLIFAEEIIENIVLTDDEVDYPQLKRSVSTADFYSVVNNLKYGFRQKLELNGKGLSKGQAQRLLLSRILYKDSDFLFFDEATSNIDSLSHNRILENLIGLKEKTIVFVTHKIHKVVDADYIIVMDKGGVKESGTHDDLMAKGDLYYKLYISEIGEKVTHYERSIY